MSFISDQSKKRRAETGSKAAGPGGGNKAVGLTARRVSDRMFTSILVGVMLVGIGLLAYPSLADYWNSFHQSRAVISYAENVANMQTDDYDQILESARGYNTALAQQGINWWLTDEAKAAYNEELNIDGSGIMGYINIQKIHVTLPIYHGTDEAILQTSIGHLQGSSLPVGGESTHCLLSGHRGLPSARLFTDLDKLKEGDTFTLTVLNETLTYEVDHIWIVEPEDLTHLAIEEGQDLCTLITCTPYGINTHRLLVRGHRIANADGDAMIIADAIQIRPVFIAPFLAVPILLLLLIYVLISTAAGKRSRKDGKTKYLEDRGLEEAVLEPEDRDEFIEAIRAIVSSRKGKSDS